ncbi:sugar kinase [Tuanshanicoccus lijuaniae]|uniref:PfkB family carbohydrate kinase n=1 Tax=Aerococcaceae bacterium zg-1292 TaxID=2774330 RepID=UPI001934E86E|nr:sugar kinase [Aerococcaceae bacterium zg-1292]QQA36993.1 sugar kinase [Aerococcaceae bacterium zg-1292]
MKVLTFGEMMLRLKTPNNERILQTQSFEASYGGAEANVAISLALLGNDVAYLSKFPNNLLGTAAENTLKKYGVDTTKILKGEGRIGTYYFEKGASVRATNVIYDRKGSVLEQAKAEEFDWSAIFSDVDYFYLSGITPAISKEMQKACLAACVYCNEHDIPIACDLNYRGKMWSTDEAQEMMSTMMQYVTICIAHDEDFEATLGIPAFDGDSSRGIAQKETFKAAMREVQERYPNIKMVASVLRNIYSVEDSQWSALLLNDDTFYETPVYDVHVMEGVAAGDAFGAGLLHGILHHFDNQKLIDFALSASLLKLTITGDLNLVSEEEILAGMNSNAASRLSR